MGFLLLLERLTPIERAVFVLHDVLDHPYELVAEAVGRTEDACRQALSRARKHVTVPARRTPAERQQAEEVATRFMTVGIGGDVDALLAALAPDVVVTSDGGGVARAAIRPVVGAGRVGPLPRQPRAPARAPTRSSCRARSTGRPGVVVHIAEGGGRRCPSRPTGDVGDGRPHRRQPGQAGTAGGVARTRRRGPPGRLGGRARRSGTARPARGRRSVCEKWT